MAGIKITQLRPQHATGRRYGSFEDRPEASGHVPPAAIFYPRARSAFDPSGRATFYPGARAGFDPGHL